MVLSNVHVIIVCVNYGDLLKFTIEKNIKFFDKANYHVITSPEDTETISYCEKAGAQVILYPDFFKNAKLNKSGPIFLLQEKLHKEFPEDWILLIDADIILPEDFEELFKKKELNKKSLYSMTRYDYVNQADYLSQTNLKPYSGQIFMGYMQLYHDKTKYYPPYSQSCASCDDVFQRYFHSKEYFDTTAFVTHLGQDTVNHNGRVSMKWN